MSHYEGTIQVFHFLFLLLLVPHSWLAQVPFQQMLVKHHRLLLYALVLCLSSIVRAHKFCAMSKDEVMPRALVIFRWNRRSQTDPDLERRARALDGRVVRIMDKPFWNNERRIQIQSLEDSNLTLGVRMKYLELIRLPQPTNEHTEIDLFVYRSDPFTNILPHIASNEYLRQELRIADDAQYQNVITNHPNITILPSIGSNKWTPCIDSGIYGPNLALILLMKGMNFMISLQMPDKNAVDKLRTLLSGLLWHIWEFEQLDPTIPPFPEMLEYLIFTVWTSPAIRKVMLRHYNRLEYYQQFVTLEAELEASDAWRFAMFTIQEHIERQTSLFEHQLERSLASNLDISAMEFYEKQIQSMDALFRSNDSEFMQTLLEIVDLYKDHNISAERISVRCERIKSHVQDYAIKILHFLESMRYYLSVGEILVNLRESGDAGGRIAIVCIQNFITGDWVRAIADIMRCSQRCVAMKVIPNDKRKRETEESPRAFVGLLSNSSTTCENGIRSQNQENNEPIVEANAAQTYHNRATITLYGLIPSQRNLHGELQQHLLSTRKSDLFISMHKIPDSQHRPGMASKTYWTEHDEILEILIGILKDPRMWLDSDYTTDLMRSCLKYFAELDDVQEVDELVTSMEEYHSRTSREHQLLCQDVGHSIILFRKMIGRDISSRSDGRTLRVKLRNTVDTLDLAVAWWQLALSMLCIVEF